MHISLPLVEQWLQEIITYLLPYATSGMLVAACVVAVSRLPLLSIAAMTAACACLGAFLSTGVGGLDVGMQMVAAAVVAGGILLLSGGVLWRRPSLGRLLRRPGAQETAPSSAPEVGLAQNLAFRLASVVVIGLAAEALSPLSPLPVAAQEMRLAAWLVGMGLFAGLSSGSALVSGTGYVMALGAVSLLVADLVTDVSARPMAFAAIAALMIIAALGFSFADTIKRRPSAQAVREVAKDK